MSCFASPSWDVDFSSEKLNKQLFGNVRKKKSSQDGKKKLVVGNQPKLALQKKKNQLKSQVKKLNSKNKHLMSVIGLKTKNMSSKTQNKIMSSLKNNKIKLKNNKKKSNYEIIKNQENTTHVTVSKKSGFKRKQAISKFVKHTNEQAYSLLDKSASKKKKKKSKLKQGKHLPVSKLENAHIKSQENILFNGNAQRKHSKTKSSQNLEFTKQEANKKPSLVSSPLKESIFKQKKRTFPNQQESEIRESVLKNKKRTYPYQTVSGEGTFEHDGNPLAKKHKVNKSSYKNGPESTKVSNSFKGLANKLKKTNKKIKANSLNSDKKNFDRVESFGDKALNKNVPISSSMHFNHSKKQNLNPVRLELNFKQERLGGTLRERVMAKLQTSRFRFLNEQMYTTEGREIHKYFKNYPDAFFAYHEGYKQQIAQWPLNPLDVIINTLKKKPSSLVIADFGCGDARLSKLLPNVVHSFDVVGLTEDVTVCDMAHTPLPSDSVDVAVFCLSLMGTNLVDYIMEANRVLKQDGILKIAEVESRFDNIDNFINHLQKFGFTKLHKDVSHDLFCFMDFKKISVPGKKNKLPFISLRPCLYKKR
uniref:Ribosomal RNA-processing protein 8 n=1 Tax=Timema genevievae TaxID=629358 RepID=A0A7R9JQZ6_TIMGE|nr:unnamed protein product [Timema genevievae]